MRLPFVGREREVAELLHGLAEASAKQARLYLLSGGAGIGKSRLTEELVAAIDDPDALVIVARCWEAGGAPAYSPWLDALAAIVERRGGDEWLRSQLGPAADHLAELFDGSTAVSADRGEVDPQTARFRLFEAVVATLRAAAEGSLLVLVLDDIHVADAPSLLLLQHLARRLVGSRILLVSTYRDDEVRAGSALADALADLLRSSATRRIVLTGLNERAIARLVDDVGIGPAVRGHSADVVSQLRDKTEGNPLYVGEVVRMLAGSGTPPDGGLEMPADLREIILRRIAHLSTTARDTLERAAILGREFDLDLLAELGGHAPAPGLDEASRMAVVTDVPGRAERMRFSHAMVREALYRDISPSRRRQLHGIAADALEAAHGGVGNRASELAHHLSAAVPEVTAVRAATAAMNAGRSAVARLAFEEGVRLLRVADRLLERDATALDRALALLALGDAQMRAGDADSSRATFVTAASLARTAGDGPAIGEAALGYGGRFVWMRAGLDTRLVPLLTEALEAIPPTDSVLRARLLARLAGARRDEPDPRERAAIAQQAVDVARRLDEPTTLIWALSARFTAIFGPDSVDEMVELADEIEALAAVSGEEERIGDACWMVFLVSTMVGDLRRARAQVPAYARLADDLRQPSQRWYAGVMQSIVLILDGRLAEAEELMDQTVQLGAGAQPWDASASHRFSLSMIRWEQGRLAEMEPLLRRSATEHPGYPMFGCLLALVEAQGGRLEVALERVDALGPAGGTPLPRDAAWVFGMTLLAEVVWLARDADRADALYEALLPHRRLVGTASGEVVSGSVERPLGLLAAVLGRPADAAQHLTDALERHRSMGAPQWIAHSQHDLAALLLDRGGPGDAAAAIDLLEPCIPLAERLGLTEVARRARSLLELAEGHRARRTSSAHGLTPRETEVVGLVAQGQSNRDIAGVLVVSERTVESHVQNILTKLGFTSRTQIATWALAHGWPSPS
ncbi:MAG: AAA family ATPase [Acidimicrobiales bacterium]|nr:AAA family ATPase [Acidimicrobiales bacterium]